VPQVNPSFTYLDFNATAPAKPEVVEAVRQTLEVGGNPSSVHALGRQAKGLVENARRSVAVLINADAAGITFTGGGTEANNLVFTGALKANKIERLVIASTEHESVRLSAENTGLTLEVLPCGLDGMVDAAALKQVLAESEVPTLVSIMLANNESGILQPITELCAITKEAGALFHCDAVQAAGKVEIDFKALGVDLMTLSAHKFAGPQGVGALIRRGPVEVSAQILGGGQELGRRSGTENLAGIVGFGVAADRAVADLGHMHGLAHWRDELESEIRKVEPGALFIGEHGPRLPNTSLVALPGVKAETQVMTLDLAGFGVSAGSACSSGKVAASHVLNAMGFEEDISACAIRVSFGWNTTRQDIEDFLAAWKAMRSQLTRSKTQTATEVA
jgi:cysteine desulfurase